MSYTEIYAITKKRKLVLVGEIKQAQLGCLWIWTKLLNEYFPDKKPTLENFSFVWNLINSGDKQLDFFEIDVLKSTFDTYICKKDFAEQLSESLKLFNEKYSNLDNLNPNLKEQFEILSKLSKYNKYICFVFNQTSVNRSLWKDRDTLEKFLNQYL